LLVVEQALPSPARGLVGIAGMHPPRCDTSNGFRDRRTPDPTNTTTPSMMWHSLRHPNTSSATRCALSSRSMRSPSVRGHTARRRAEVDRGQSRVRSSLGRRRVRRAQFRPCWGAAVPTWTAHSTRGRAGGLRGSDCRRFRTTATPKAAP
jgi:hypothetical protein